MVAEARRSRLARCLLIGLLSIAVLAPAARAQELTEYRLKAAFLYNFAAFTEWPSDVGPTLHLCIVGPDPLGAELNGLQGRKVGERSLEIWRKGAADSLKDCEVVFVGPGAVAQLPHVLERLRGQAALTIADSPGAARQGVALNMILSQGRIVFEANQSAARAARLTLSSKLLRLASEVLP